MQVVRRASLKSTPWKNGGGITHEIIRVPATGERFSWRLSVAQIDMSGPFSDFAGYDRKMVLLRGSGVRLSFDTADPVALLQVGDMVGFDGAHRAYCQLVDGPCTDLNLMVAQSSGKVTATVEQIAEPRLLPASPHAITLVFGINAGLWVDSLGSPVRLGPWDLAVLPKGVPVTVAPELERDSSCLVFCATLDDNSP